MAALTVKNIANVLLDLSTADCYSLGVQLDIPTNKLRDIELEAVEKRKLKMIEIWLESDLKCTWEKLACALEKINKKVMAQRVRSIPMKHLSSGYESDSVISQDLDGLADTHKLQDRQSGT